jgi:hypothetical protein
MKYCLIRNLTWAQSIAKQAGLARPVSSRAYFTQEFISLYVICGVSEIETVCIPVQGKIGRMRKLL